MVELLLDSGASVDKPKVVTYRLAFTQTLRERVFVAQWISMWILHDIVDYRSIELHYRLEYVIFGFQFGDLIHSLYSPIICCHGDVTHALAVCSKASFSVSALLQGQVQP